MGETNPLAIDLDDAGFAGLFEASRRLTGVADRAGDSRDRRVRERSSEQQHLTSRRREPAQPLGHQEPEVRGDRQGLGQCWPGPGWPGAAALEGTGHFQGHHCVPAGRLVQPDEHRAGQRQIQPGQHDPSQAADAERANDEFLAGQPQIRGGSSGRFRAIRGDQPHRLVIQPSERVAEHGARAGVEPLHVVDGEQQRRAPGECTEHAEHRDSYHSPARLAVAGVGQEQRSRERPVLHCGQSRQHRGVELIEQISARPANASAASGSLHRQLRTCVPAAAASSSPSVQMAVLPIPACPARVSEAGP